ncbi:DUF5908 family protein [Flavobacteriaceae bacterium]|nr:DUF5908 family protein [Flavobacteriaceae bacterium]MDA8947837.1 DUF5908 family protein [Flavobacteriaceae bacterium]MDA9016356.1 DUF5908 family protein [Flavobacteriaceae bacterium]MDA9572232.1 DUF5908 family protein [Flavobacteriaceae bacterium]
MPLEIKELIVKGTVDSEENQENVDVVKLIDEKLSEMSIPQCSLNKPSFIEECVQEVLSEIRKQLDY